MRIIVVLIILFIASCAPPPEPVNLAGNNWLGYQPLFVGYQRAQQDNVKLSFDLHQLPSTSNVLRLMAEGWLDGGLLTIDEAISYQASTGERLCVLMVTNVSLGGDAVIMQPSWHAQKDPLKIGHEATAVGRYMLQRAQQHNAFGKKAIEPVIASVNQHSKLFKQQKVQGVVTFYPTLREIKNAGGEVVFDSTQIPNEIVDVAVIKAAVFKQHGKQVLGGLTRIWDDTIDEFHSLPTKLLTEVANNTGLSAEQIGQALEGVKLLGVSSDTQFDLRFAAKGVSQNLLQTETISEHQELSFCNSGERA